MSKIYHNPAGYLGTAPQGPQGQPGIFIRPQGAGGYNPLADSALFEWWDGRVNVTVTGQGVSSWVGRGPLALDIPQTTDDDRPPYANPIIDFDGVSDELGPLTFAAAVEQPITYFMLMRQKSWTEGDMIFDGGASSNRNSLRQSTSGDSGVAPDLNMYAGGGSGSPKNSDATLGEWVVVCAKFAGDNSQIIVNDGTPTENGAPGDPGSNNMPGILLADRSVGGDDADIQIQQLIMLEENSSAAKITEVTQFLQSIAKGNFASDNLLTEDFDTDLSAWTGFGDSQGSIVAGQFVLDADGGSDGQRQFFTSASEVYASWKMSQNGILDNFGGGDDSQGVGLANTNQATMMLGVGYIVDSGVLKYRVIWKIDGSEAAALIESPLPVEGQLDDILVHFVQASAPAADDGVIQVRINGVLVTDLSNVDNDLLDADVFVIGTANSATPSPSNYTMTQDTVRVGTLGII